MSSRTGWFVLAIKGTKTITVKPSTGKQASKVMFVETVEDKTTTVRLPAPDGVEQANRMAELLFKHGWGGHLLGGRPGSGEEGKLKPSGRPSVFEDTIDADDRRFHGAKV